jgi:hypothetical protein
MAQEKIKSNHVCFASFLEIIKYVILVKNLSTLTWKKKKNKLNSVSLKHINLELSWTRLKLNQILLLYMCDH